MCWNETGPCCNDNAVMTMKALMESGNDKIKNRYEGVCDKCCLRKTHAIWRAWEHWREGSSLGEGKCPWTPGPALQPALCSNATPFLIISSSRRQISGKSEFQMYSKFFSTWCYCFSIFSISSHVYTCLSHAVFGTQLYYKIIHCLFAISIELCAMCFYFW